MPSDSENSSSLVIAALSSADKRERAKAAQALYASGCAQALDATRAWRADSELSPLLTGHPTVGVAVQPETFAKIRQANGSPALADVPPDQDAREFELHFSPEISLDILTTREPGGSGAIARFLSRRGEGVQQVEFPVTNVDRATQLLRERFGIAPLYPATRPGANATRVNFFLISAGAAGKVLIELVESPPGTSA
jgi:methylmalonyl-CoA/ethylmalonyl-CoA epimerase